MNTDKVAIVTGGAMGFKSGGASIGGAAAIRLAKDGYKVVVVDTLKAAGQKTVEIIESNGGEAAFLQLDVTKSDNAKQIVEFAQNNFGGVSCLVNCVAKYSPGMAKNIVDISEKDWQKTLDVNLNGYFMMSKYSIPAMIASGGGTIINISSIESYVALPNFSVYSVAKAAIDALTRTIATDFAPIIRANSVAPGFVKIENSENKRSSEELEQWYAGIAKQYPMQRVCEAEDVAGVISFLASSDSAYVNGQTIVVDGGKSIADIHEF
jgi:NAD(P)-dependent dehydrogenase (short-subunit alcohol dehydrogenase family)